MKLRPYQNDALRISKEKLDSGISRQLISLPTGTGKTVIFSALPKHHGIKGRTLVLVHREELANQAADKIQRWNPDFKVGVEMGERVSPADTDVVVASVATIGREGSPRLTQFDKETFGAVICDEAHHSIAPSYQTVFRHFGLLDENNKRLLFGVTATPNRGDGQGLGQIYDEIICPLTIQQAIQQGWLADIRGLTVRTNASLEGVKVRAGDFALKELEDAVNTEERNHLIVQSWLKNGEDRQTIAFTVDIAHAKQLAKTFQAYGVDAEPVWGEDNDRALKLKYHREGKIKVLTNCGVLTEGYDDWRIGCVIMARPTKSQLLFVQMAGRGTRIPDGVDNIVEWKSKGIPVEKEDCLLIDVVDNSVRHSLVTLPSLFGMAAKLDLRGASVLAATEKFQEAQKQNPDIDFDRLQTLEELDSYVEMVDLFTVKWPEEVEQNSKLQWHKAAEDSYWITLPTKEQVYIKKNLLDKWDVGGDVHKNHFEEKGIHYLPEAFRVAESYITMFGRELLTLLRRKSAWHKHPATTAQKNLLRRIAYKVMPDLLKRVSFDTLSKGEATTLINKLTAMQFEA